MPYLNIITNQSPADATAFLSKASQAVAQATGKPEQYVFVALEHKTALVFAGSDAPAAMLDYRALGLPSNRQAFSAALCQLIQEELGVDGSRIYISMNDSERQNWGWNHSTF